MSAQWWDFTPGATTPKDAICGMFMAKMRFYSVQRLLHLPFLLKALGDRKYEGSRLSTLKSSRELIKAYNVLRDEKRPVLTMCDMADYFGRVEIGRSNTRHDMHALYTQRSSETNHGTQGHQDSVSALEGSIESMISLDSYLFPMPAASRPWQVADKSWTHMLDSSMADG